MKFVTAFFMAWGNFITLPCPYKRWDSSLKNLMLSLLPGIGMVIGVIWMGLFWVLSKTEIPVVLASFFMMFYIFAICGFMHLDGFMDCNDAILSRRPLEERQRILKDSTVGAFAAVTLAFLLLGWFAAMNEAIYRMTFIDLMIIPVVSRGISSMCVLTYKPIGHSQYVEDYKEPGRGKYRLAVILQIAVITGLVMFLGQNPLKTGICAGAEVLVAFAACLYARKQLGGMSGDIAGYTICMSELAGIIALAWV